MHTVSLIPSVVRTYYKDAVTFSDSWFAYYSAHSLNCILTKLTLIACHKRMRERFQRFFYSRLSDSSQYFLDTAKYTDDHFSQMQNVWQTTKK
ncbi:hypothetical protein PMAYCL1PPCAC_28023, partial [Pristionchus mayeri]